MNLVLLTILQCIHKTVTITGVDDTIPDGNVGYNISASSVTSVDPIFNGAAFTTQTLSNIDNDRRIYVTTGTVQGNVTIASADSLCNSDSNKPTIITTTYKALLVDNILRVASVTANLGNGQVDWVLQNGVRYYNSAGASIIQQGNGNRLFTFPLTTTAGGTLTYWTGLNTDWTYNTNNCSTWTSTTGNGRTGISNSTTSTSISNTNQLCSSSQRILCVGQ
jgi:Protein of unknown function (DUF1554)